MGAAVDVWGAPVAVPFFRQSFLHLLRLLLASLPLCQSSTASGGLLLFCPDYLRPRPGSGSPRRPFETSLWFMPCWPASLSCAPPRSCPPPSLLLRPASLLAILNPSLSLFPGTTFSPGRRYVLCVRPPLGLPSSACVLTCF